MYRFEFVPPENKYLRRFHHTRHVVELDSVDADLDALCTAFASFLRSCGFSVELGQIRHEPCACDE